MPTPSQDRTFSQIAALKMTRATGSLPLRRASEHRPCPMHVCWLEIKYSDMTIAEYRTFNAQLQMASAWWTLEQSIAARKL